jgi:cell shape-determining protein MreC
LALSTLLLAATILTLLGPGVSGHLRSMVHWAFAFPGDAGMYLTTSLKEMLGPAETLSLEDARVLREENQALRRTLLTRQQRIEDLTAKLHGGVKLYNRVFSGQFAPGSDVPIRLIAARVVAADSLPYGWTRVINLGTQKGVRKNMVATERRLLTDREKAIPFEPLPALSTSALAGRVVETAAYTARLQLVIDRGFESPVQIRRIPNPDNPRTIRIGALEKPLTATTPNPPISGIAYGDGKEGIDIPDVPAVANIRPGDIVQTDSALGALPASILIGTVTEILPAKHPGRVTLKVSPACDFSTLRYVYIVVPSMGTLAPDPEGF